MLTHFPLLTSKARVSAISSAFWAETWERSTPDSIPSCCGVTAYPEDRLPFRTKLLPSVNNSQSGLSTGLSPRSGLLEYTASIVCKQSWPGVPSTCWAGKNIAGLMMEVVLSVTKHRVYQLHHVWHVNDNALSQSQFSSFLDLEKSSCHCPQTTRPALADIM